MAGNVVAKAGRTSGRIGLATGGDNELGCRKSLLAGFDMEEVVHLADGHHLSPCADIDAVFQHFHLQALDNGLGAIGGRKDTTVVLHFELDPVFLKEIHDVMVVKLRKDAVQKAAIARNAS